MVWNSDVWLQVTSMILVFVSLLLAIFLATVASKNKKGIICLAIYLLINALDYSSFFYHSFTKLSPILEMIRIDLGSFLKYPFLFFFVLSVLYSDFKLRQRHLLHAIPFLINTLILLPGFYLVNSASKVRFFNDHMHSFEGTFTIALSTLQFFFYIVFIFVLLARYKTILLENYSQLIRVNYSWLLRMNLFLLVLFAASLTHNIYRWGFDRGAVTEYRLIMVVVHLGFICWLILKAMYGPAYFSGIESKLAPVSSYLPASDLTAGNSSDKEIPKELMLQITMLRNHMLDKQPFLDPDLTIKELARQIGTDTKATSLLINHTLNQNFYDFINHYRIQKAAEMLRDPVNRKMTVLEILYHVGFNSKSSFNTSFKKNTGYTPTEFRKQHQEA